MSQLLSPEQLTPARRYRDTLTVRILLRGEKYWRQNRVVKLSRGEDENHIYATVRGTESYQVSLYFSGGTWEGTCSCMAGQDCKHCAAAMLEVLDQAQKRKPVTSKPAEKSTAGALSKAAAKVAKYSAPPAPKPESFSSVLRGKLGRTLSHDEQRAASAVDDLYNRHRGAKLVAENVFDPIRGTHASWSWNSIIAWPTAPHTPWETWLYVAALFRRKEWNCPPALMEVTDWVEVREKIGAWERTLEIEKWNDWLTTHAHLLHDEDSISSATMQELRLRLTPRNMLLEWRRVGAGDFNEMKVTAFRQHVAEGYSGKLPFDTESLALWRIVFSNSTAPVMVYDLGETRKILNAVLRLPGFEGRVVNADGVPFRHDPEPLAWSAKAPTEEKGEYELSLVLPDGSAPEPPMAVMDGEPSLYVTRDSIRYGPPLAGLNVSRGPLTIPAEALETRHGIGLLKRIAVPPPERIAAKTRTIPLRAVFRCSLDHAEYSGERFHLKVTAETDNGALYSTYGETGWMLNLNFKEPPELKGLMVIYDRSSLRMAPGLVEELRLSWQGFGSDVWTRQSTRNFPEQFAAWVAAMPSHPGIVLEIDPLLATLREGPVSARVSLDVSEAGIDWFDLRVSLDVSDTTLSEEEVRLLLDARGGFVRLGTRGWKRLQFELSEEEEFQLAEVGLSARDFSSEPQRLHALQLAGKKAASRMLPEEQALAIERRAEQIRTSVNPDVPAELGATLRPYQIEGFHFLAYLSENHFGGVLADDMGLGKTVQALAWLLWLRGLPESAGLPSLVVCPKSVTDNWLSEAARFAPTLPTRMLPRGGCDLEALKIARADAGLLIINYAQLRSIEALAAVPWEAVILDEAQYIKNPQSQTAQCASLLQAGHRLALSGTPIENRLLDLWSIMRFAMPGVLGNRASFTRNFDQKSDPHARRRLAARVRPFVIRRTKREVASDLPERTEEDILCELESEQSKLYNAELKRARAALLNIKTSSELDKARFNILTSLLRLRQICCHPLLVNPKATEVESAKLNALLDLLEPLMEEGQKVLVFSQFVEMLEIIRAEVTRREWKHFMLTGQTEDRGTLVADFQKAEGAAVFLISLRAGGFGLNLTAASYVVLFDPWWNPAVENQAIDRTHRIGQTNNVIAYRLLTKTSIEEKIRHLQKQKSSLAEDILGEETFTKALTLDDFRFLLEGN